MLESWVIIVYGKMSISEKSYLEFYLINALYRKTTEHENENFLIILVYQIFINFPFMLKLKTFYFIKREF